MEPFHLEIVVNFATTARAVWCSYPAVNMIPLYTFYLILPAPTHATCNIIITKILWLTDWPPFSSSKPYPGRFHPKTTRNSPDFQRQVPPRNSFNHGTCRASWLYASRRASDVVSGWIPGDWRIPILMKGEAERSRGPYYVPKKSRFFMYRSHILPTQDGMNYHTKNHHFEKNPESTSSNLK